MERHSNGDILTILKRKDLPFGVHLKTAYLHLPNGNFMIRVEDLENLVEILKSEGVTVLDQIEVYDYGKFLHIMDPEGK